MGAQIVFADMLHAPGNKKISHFKSAMFVHKSSKYTNQNNRKDWTNKIFKIHLKGQGRKNKMFYSNSSLRQCL